MASKKPYGALLAQVVARRRQGGDSSFGELSHLIEDLAGSPLSEETIAKTFAEAFEDAEAEVAASNG